MTNRFLANARGFSVGAKLAVVLLVVVFGSLVLLSVAQYWLGQDVLQRHYQQHLAVHLKKALNYMDTLARKGEDPAQTLARVQRHAAMLPPSGRDFHLFGLDPEGKVVVKPLKGWTALPPPEVLRHMASTAWGVASFRYRGEPVMVAYDRLADGSLVVGVMASPLLPPGPLGLPLWLVSLLTAALVAVAAAVAAVLWVHFTLSRPLGRLAAEAEQAAAGELKPPAPLERDDELGRLSLALNHLTGSARNMVHRAREQEARYRRLFNDTKDGVFTTNADGRLNEVNPALVKMFGYESAEQILGRDSTQDFFIEPEEAQLYLNSLWAQDFVQDFPATMRRPDGSEFEVLITATRAGLEKARFGLVRDVTQLRADQRALGESEARYRRLVENAPDIIYYWSFTTNHFDYVNAAVAEITGYSARRIASGEVPLDQLVHPEHRRKVRQHLSRLLKSRPGQLCGQDFMIRDASGRTRWLRDKAILVRDEMGRPLRLEGIATDITERKLLEQETKQGQRMVEGTLQGLPAAVLVLDREHKVVHWNRAMEGLTGVEAAEMVGSDRQWTPFYLKPRPVLADLVLEMDAEHIVARYAAMDLKRSTFIEDGLEGEGFFPTLPPDGRHLYFLAAPIRDHQGRITHAVETVVDLSDKRRLERELRRLSVTDSLTGLYNQRFFYATLRREIEAAQRYGQPLSLLMADLDFFKSYNDRFGHLAGDEALRRVAATLQSCVRAMDLCCRYGGEEFVVLLPHAAMSEALGVAERMRRSMAETCFSPEGTEGTVELTVSLGAATLGPEEGDQDLVRRADGALYAAKQGGAQHRGRGPGAQGDPGGGPGSHRPAPGLAVREIAPTVSAPGIAGRQYQPIRIGKAFSASPEPRAGPDWGKGLEGKEEGPRGDPSGWPATSGAALPGCTTALPALIHAPGSWWRNGWLEPGPPSAPDGFSFSHLFFPRRRAPARP